MTRKPLFFDQIVFTNTIHVFTTIALIIKSRGNTTLFVSVRCVKKIIGWYVEYLLYTIQKRISRLQTRKKTCKVVWALMGIDRRELSDRITFSTQNPTYFIGG